MGDFFAAKLWALALLAGPLFAQPLPNATVRIFAQAQDGQPIKPDRIRLVAPGSRKDYGTGFRDGMARGIPFGYYELEVEAPPFQPYKQRLIIIQEQTEVRALMLFSAGEQTGAFHFEGTVVADASSAKDLWVTAFPLAGSPGNVLQARVLPW